MFDSITEVSLLFDFYGELLTERQREVFSLYHEENFSLSEIADELGISKAGVYDTLKKAEQALKKYEEKLGLVEKFGEAREAIGKIDEDLSKLADKHPDTKADIEKIKSLIDKLDI